jgi:hypothetical protein
MGLVRLGLVTALCAGLTATAIESAALAQEGAAAPQEGAAAAPAPRKPQARKRKPAPKVLQVHVLNRRDATLVELAIVGPKDSQPTVIASGVGPGGQMTGRIPRTRGCVFTISGSFDDESTVEVASVDLCKDPRITLVE